MATAYRLASALGSLLKALAVFGRALLRLLVNLTLKGVNIQVAKTQDTNRYVLSLHGVDADNIITGPLAGATCTVDDPSKASVTADPSTAGQFFVEPVKQSSPVDGLSVIATMTDGLSGLSNSVALEWTAGAPVAVAIVVASEPIPAPASAVPANDEPPSDAGPAGGDIPVDPASPVQAEEPVIDGEPAANPDDPGSSPDPEMQD